MAPLITRPRAKALACCRVAPRTALWASPACPSPAAATVDLRSVGGQGDLSASTGHGQPFGSQHLPALGDGLLRAEVVPLGLAQADGVEALGTQPVTTACAHTLQQVRAGNLGCALTGTLSGHTIGPDTPTSPRHTLPVTWGLSVFVAYGAAVTAPVAGAAPGLG